MPSKTYDISLTQAEVSLILTLLSACDLESVDTTQEALDTLSSKLQKAVIDGE